MLEKRPPGQHDFRRVRAVAILRDLIALLIAYAAHRDLLATRLAEEQRLFILSACHGLGHLLHRLLCHIGIVLSIAIHALRRLACGRVRARFQVCGV